VTEMRGGGSPAIPPGFRRLQAGVPFSVTITSVQSNTASATVSSTTQPITVSSGVTLGNLVVCEVLGNQTGATITPPSARWARAGPQESASNQLTGIYWLVVGASDAGATSFTWTSSAACLWAITIREWNSSTGWQASPVDQVIGTSTTTNSTTVATGTTPATTQAAELAVALLSWLDNSYTESGLSAGWTQGVKAGGGTLSPAVREAYQVLSATGTQACQETLSTAAQNTGVLVTFMPAAAAGPPPPPVVPGIPPGRRSPMGFRQFGQRAPVWPLPAAVTVVQYGTATSGSVTLSQPTTQGSMLLIFCVSNQVWGTAYGTLGSSQVAAACCRYTAGHNNDFTGVWFIGNCPAGITAVSVTGTYSVAYVEVLGLSPGANPIINSGSGGSATAGTSFSLTNPGGVPAFTVYAYGYDVNNGGTPFADGTGNQHLNSNYGQISWTTGTGNSSGTMTSGTWDGCAVSFYLAGQQSVTQLFSPFIFLGRVGAAASTTAGQSTTVPITAPVAAGTTLFAIISGSASWCAGLQDTQGNAWHTETQTRTSANSALACLAHCYVVNPLSTSDEVSMNTEGAITGTIELLAWSGVAPFGPADVTTNATNTSTSATSLALSSAVAVTSPFELTILVASSGLAVGSTVTWTPPKGWTEAPTGLSPNNQVDCCWTIQNPGGSIGTPSWTQGSATAFSVVGTNYRPAMTSPGTLDAPPAMGVYRGPCGSAQQDGVVGAARSGIAAYAAWLGRPVTYVLDYVVNAPSTWAQFTGAYLYNAGGGFTNLNQWGAIPSSQQMVLGLPACVGASAGSGGSTWSAESSGTNDTYWTQLGNNLIAWGYGNAIIRLGREFNGNWYNWCPGVSGDTAAQYIAGWQHIVTLLRGLSGAQFKFMWNPSLGTSGSGSSGMEGATPTDVLQWYPGNAYVDSIGIDIYDWGTYTSQTTPPFSTPPLVNQGYNYTTLETALDGLNTIIDFANRNGLPVAFPEWGLQTWLSGGNYIGGGDDPFFITEIADYLRWCLLNAPWEQPGSGLFDTDFYSGRNPTIPAPDQSRSEFLVLLGGPANALQMWDSATVADSISITSMTVVAFADVAAVGDSIAVAVATPLADTASIADAITVTVATPFADAASVADAVRVAVTAPLADAASVTDTIAVAITTPFADAAGVADAIAVTGSSSVTFSDSATVADTAAVTEALALADAATVADSVSVSVATSLADAAGVTDTVAAAVVVSLSDAASVADAVAIPAWTAGLADAASVTDTVSVAEALALADTATVADAVALVAQSRALSDSAAVVDSDAITAVGNQLTDTVSVVDSIAIAVTAPLADSAGVADAVTVLGNSSVTFADAAAVADVIGVPTEALALADAATVTDSIAVSVAVSFADAATVADATLVSPSVQLADAAAVVDALAVPAASLAIADAAGVSDTVAVTPAVTLHDTAAVADVVAVPAVSAGVTDAAAVADSVATVAVGNQLADVVSVVDVIAVSVSTPLLDSVAITDALSVLGGGTVTLSDAAAVTDLVTLTAALALTDAAATPDSLSVSVSAPLADTAAVVDTEAVGVSVSVADAAAVADAVVVASKGNQLADTVAVTDSIVVSVAVSLTDSAGVVDTGQALGSGSVAEFDSASVSDALAVVTETLGLTDSATVSDGIAVGVAATFADSAGVIDIPNVLGNDSASVYEFVAVADSVSVMQQVQLADLAAVADSISVVVTTQLSDTAAIEDSVAVVAESLQLTDAAAIVDSVTVTGAGYVQLQDTAAVADTIAVQRLEAVSFEDVAVVADSIAVQQLINFVDAAGVSDAVEVSGIVTIALPEADVWPYVAGRVDAATLVAGRADAAAEVSGRTDVAPYVAARVDGWPVVTGRVDASVEDTGDYELYAGAQSVQR
jgi:hypothetical protein